MSSRLFSTASRASLALAIGLTAAHAASAQAPSGQAAASDTTIEEVVVTGSFIAGTPEDAAVPVDVINNEALEKQGSPTMVQLVKTFTGAGAGIGESNRYNGGAGSATVNLRGFGSARTLVLMNSRRMADTTQAAFSGGGTDLDFIPSASIGRIEVLKDGAAATYGSDAVAGVVNFITRKDLDGFEFDAQYAAIQDSRGDYEANLAWGKTFDNGNVLLTAGYRERNVVHVLERDWALRTYSENPTAGWTTTTSIVNYLTPSGANFAAGNYVGPDGLTYNLSSAQPIRDNGCTQLGGQLTSTAGIPQTDATATTTSQCRFQFTPWNDLVNDEYHYQLYAEANYEFSEALEVHTEVFYSRHEVPRQRISPSNSTTNFPTAVQLGGTSASTATPSFNGQVPFFVPRNNPGYQATFNYVTNPTRGCAAPLTRAQCAAALSVAGLSMPQATYRAIAFSGDPNTKDGGGYQTVDADAYRVSGSAKGRLTDWLTYDAGVTFMETQSRVSTPDILVNRLQDALNGFGSRKGDANQCTQAEKIAANAGNAAAGCYWFNPFANAQTIKLAGDVPTTYFNPAVANDPLVLQNLYEKPLTTLTNRLIVGEVVFAGDLPITLPGGQVQAAAGAQYRKRTFLGDYSRLNNSDITPCVDSVDDGIPVCNSPTGALIFNASNGNYNYTDDVYAGFAEVRIPILDNFEVTGAIRHEDYGSIGTTTNPKVAARFEPLDWLTLRASASTTFRAPTALTTTPRAVKGQSLLGGAYKATLTSNNPDLKPETADTFNIGFVVKKWGFTGSVDWYQFKFKDELTTETPALIFAQASRLATAAACNDPALALLKARFDYAVGTVNCATSGIILTRSNQVNGPDTKTSGIDFRGQYDFDIAKLASFEELQATVGFEATYLLEYKRTAFTLLGADDIILQPAVDRSGTHDLLSAFFSYPKVRATGFASLSSDTWSLRWQTLYHEGTRPSSALVTYDANGVAVPEGKSRAFWQHDIVFRIETRWDAAFTLSVQNLFDRDPPFKHSQYNYDYTSASPLGRVVEVGVKKTF